MLGGTAGFSNDGDNEITGIHVSDGDPTTGGILGAKEPKPFTATALARLLDPAARRQQHVRADPVSGKSVRRVTPTDE